MRSGTEFTVAYTITETHTDMVILILATSSFILYRFVLRNKLLGRTMV